MSNNLKGLEFDGHVREQLNLINEVFRDAGAEEVFDNPDITFDDFLIFGHYIKFNLRRPNTNSVELDFHFMSDGMRIDFEGYDEAYEFSKEAIQKENSKVKDILGRLFSGNIMVEYKGNAQFVNLFNDDGSRYAIWSLGNFLTLLTNGYWKSQNISQHLFSPIYPRKK